MCASCHLAPGQAGSELRQGLYPLPPDLTAEKAEKADPRRAFWVIKHGVKISAMPAWGATHDDTTIWSMVAFLQTLPKPPALNAVRQAASAAAPGGSNSATGSPR